MSSPNVFSARIASQNVSQPPPPGWLHECWFVGAPFGQVAGKTQHVLAGVTPMVVQFVTACTFMLQNAPPEHFGVVFAHFAATPSGHCDPDATLTPAAAASCSFQYVR